MPVIARASWFRRAHPQKPRRPGAGGTPRPRVKTMAGSSDSTRAGRGASVGPVDRAAWRRSVGPRSRRNTRATGRPTTRIRPRDPRPPPVRRAADRDHSGGRNGARRRLRHGAVCGHGRRGGSHLHRCRVGSGLEIIQPSRRMARWKRLSAPAAPARDTRPDQTSGRGHRARRCRAARGDRSRPPRPTRDGSRSTPGRRRRRAGGRLPHRSRD